jgi:chromosome segregation ATPase
MTIGHCRVVWSAPGKMEVNVGDHSNRLIDVEQDIDRLQSDTRTANEFVGQRLAKLGNRVQATEETVQATQEDLRSTQGRIDKVEDTMKAMTLTLQGIRDTHQQIQSGWGGMLDRLENLPRSITNAVDTWVSINLRRNQAAATQTVTEAQLHGPTTDAGGTIEDMWFGKINDARSHNEAPNLSPAYP